MAYSDFTNLRIYQLAEKLSDEIWELVIQWKEFEKDAIGKQLIRSADSIGANIAEGKGRSTFTDTKRFIIIARGSLYETKHFLRRVYRRKLINQDKTQKIKLILDELSPKLNAYINSLKKLNTQHPTPNTQHPTPNTQHPTTNTQHPTTNNQQPTTNN